MLGKTIYFDVGKDVLKARCNWRYILYEQIRPLQLKELEILKELDRICRKHNIPYFLAYGTLVGAVRHKGFIPWDDDIDTAMLYSDYLRFEELCKTELSEGFFLQTRNTEPEAGLTYDKLRLDATTFIIDYMSDKDIHHGVHIDIQAVYNIPDNIVLRTVQLVNAAVYMLLQEGRPPRNHGNLTKAVSTVLLFIIRGKTRKKIRDRCFRNMGKYEGIKTKYKAKLFGNLRICRTLYPAEAFKSTLEVPFEDGVFSIPIGYDEILKRYYGDYMQLPPKDEQGIKLEHIVKLDLDKPYTYYKGNYYCAEQ